jgi:hypothetical protein
MQCECFRKFNVSLRGSALIAECRWNGVHCRLTGARTTLELRPRCGHPLITPRSGPPAVSPAVVHVEGVIMANNVAQTRVDV